MPLYLPEGIPAIQTLHHEHVDGINGYGRDCARRQDCLHIVVLNLMPKKEETESDLARVLAYSSHKIQLSFMRLRSHSSKNTSAKHLERFYQYADEMMEQHFDGMIVTGAPVETIDYEEVDYWHELTTIFDWAHTHVRSTLYLCWGAMAALYHFYDIPKYLLPAKRFGVFTVAPTDHSHPLFSGFDDTFSMPNSRHTEIRRHDIERTDGVTILAEADEAGLCICASRHYRDFYVLGHLEYPAWTLGDEYHRDLGKRDDVNLPQHYYPNDDPDAHPRCNWRAAATLFYNNWINHYVCRLEADKT